MTPYLDPATLAMKQVDRWYSERLEADTQIVRWGNFGAPLLLFPTAGGDAEEVERFFLIRQLEPFIRAGRLKVYSVDSINGRTWLTHPSVAHRVWIHRQFSEYIQHEVVPWIRHDCRSESIEIMTSGASIGALNSLIGICRNPEIFSAAICMSGTYDVEKWMEGQWFDEFHFQSPLHFVPGLPEGPLLQQLRQRLILLPVGQGENEDVDESWAHDWVTWREMLPKYVQELLTARESSDSPESGADA